MQTPVVVLNVGDLLLGGLVIVAALVAALRYSPPVAGAARPEAPVPGGDTRRRGTTHAIAALGQDALAAMTAIRTRREAAWAEHGELIPDEAAFLDRTTADQLAAVREEYERKVRALKEAPDDD